MVPRQPGVWVWEEDAEILGFSAADTRDGSIWALFVAPDRQRRGIGRALFEKALDVLRQNGSRTAWLTTEPGSRAERFYRAAGWKVIGTSPKGERIFHSDISRKPPEKREPASDIDTGVANSLKALDPNRPIREADVELASCDVRY